MKKSSKRRSFWGGRSATGRKKSGFRPLMERLEERRVLAVTITVNSTGDDTKYVDDDQLTLREALMIVNGDLDPTADLTPEEMLLVAPSDPADLTDTIVFDFPFNDGRHFYYRDDGMAGQVTPGNIDTTVAIDDGDISDIDPDWQHSWYSIQLVAALKVNVSCTIDGYSELKAQPNTNPAGQGLNTVLRVELDGGSRRDFLQLLAVDGNETVVRGLAINHGGSGVQVGKVDALDLSNIRFEGNFVGTDISGTHVFNQNSNGIQTLVTPPLPGLPAPPGGTHYFGGTTPESRNLISGNQYAYLSHDTTSPFTATIEGNLIGTDITGTKALGNERGFYIIRTNSTYVVGGPTTDSTNVISGNVVGALIDTTSAATLENNLFGTDVTGVLDVGNTAVGILLRSGKNFIQHNTIAFNGISPPTGTPSGYTKAAGIRVYSLPGDPGQLNVFSQNSIFSNYGPGIDLKDDGVTANDLKDVDTGPNSLQNFPVLGVATSDSGGTTVTGTINSTPNTNFRIEFYSTPDIQAQRSGKYYLGSVDVLTDANGDASYTFVTATVVNTNEFITSTATRLDAMLGEVETSEFSDRIQVNLPTFSVDDVSVVEGNTGQRTVSFTVTLSHAQVLPVMVTVNSADDSATSGSDYQSIIDQVLTFNPGESLTQTVTVKVNGDTKAELDETYFLRLSNAVNATIADDEGLGTIVNDDYPSISISDVTVVEGNSGTVDAVFTVTLSQAPAEPLMVTVNTADGTAKILDNDYQAVSGLVLTFLPGDPLTQTVTVQVNGDTKIELNETFSVVLSNAVKGIIADATGVGTITTDDFPTLSISDVTVTEGDSGTTSAVFNISLSDDPSGPVTVVVNTANGTATVADGDYQPLTNLVVTFNPGDPLTQSITVLINGDHKIEGNENFFVNLSNPVNAIFADEQGVGTIVTDDFRSVKPQDLLVLGSETGGDVYTKVKLIDVKNGGTTLVTFAPYGSSFHGGARVAIGDLDGDGVAEIITAPGPGISGTVKVFDLFGTELTGFRTKAYPNNFVGGVYVSVADVNGDGWLDIITTPGQGRAAEVKVFRNRSGELGGSASGDPIPNNPYRTFLAFGKTYKGGVSVAAGDLNGDHKAEIVVGSGAGISARVRAFDLKKFTTTGLAPRMLDFAPFSSSQKNAIFVAVGNVFGSSTPEIIVGSGKSATGQVKIYDSTGKRLSAFDAYPDATTYGPIHVAAKEIDHDDALLEVVTSQGFTGNRYRRSWEPDGTKIDEVFEGDAPLFRGYFVA